MIKLRSAAIREGYYVIVNMRNGGKFFLYLIEINF